MADVNRARFDKRVKNIEKKHRPGKRIVKRVTADGLVVDVAKMDTRGLIPYKTIAMGLLIFVVMKGFLFAQIGPDEYQGRVDALQSGRSVDVAAAFLLDADPATRAIGNFVGRFVR